MKTRDALLEVIGNRAAQDTLEAAGWRRRDGEWLPPAEEPLARPTPEEQFLSADFVLSQIKTHIKWCRNHEERIALQHLKDALGL